MSLVLPYLGLPVLLQESLLASCGGRGWPGVTWGLEAGGGHAAFRLWQVDGLQMPKAVEGVSPTGPPALAVSLSTEVHPEAVP